MTTDEAQRFLAACRHVGEHPEEKRLLTSEISAVKLFRSGTSATYEVTFSDGSRASFKPIEGVEASAAGYGHTATGVILNDYASWLVARALGFEALLRGVVIATSPEPGVGIGTMQTWLEGQPSGSGWEQASQLRQAALFDAVIAQQDRNGSNFNYDDATDELGLFDQSFSFALPGHNTSASVIVGHFHSQGTAALDQPMLDALDRFDASAERTALTEILAPDRFAQMESRIQMMRQRGELLQTNEY